MKLFKQIGLCFCSSQSVSRTMQPSEAHVRSRLRRFKALLTHSYSRCCISAQSLASRVYKDDDGAKEIDFQVMGPLVMQPALDFRTMGDGRTRLFGTAIIWDAHFRQPMQPNNFRLTPMREQKCL